MTVASLILDIRLIQRKKAPVNRRHLKADPQNGELITHVLRPCDLIVTASSPEIGQSVGVQRRRAAGQLLLGSSETPRLMAGAFLFLGSGMMAGKTVTRAELSEAVRQKLGLSRAESAELVEQVLSETCDRLTAGEDVKLSGFGLFEVRGKGERIGRNPKTGVEVPIAPRRVLAFRPSNLLKAHINGSKKKPRPG